jgi:hypothetical protein
MVLHSEQRKRPGFNAFSFFEQIGHEKIFGKMEAVAFEAPFPKKWMASSTLSFMLKNCEKPSN